MSASINLPGLLTAMTVILIHTLWIAALLGAGALATRLALSRARPATRYTAALAWLVLLALTPFGTALWFSSGNQAHIPRPTGSATPIAALPITPPPEIKNASAAHVEPTVLALPAVSSFPTNDHDLVNGWVASRQRLTVILPLAWIAGAAGMLTWSFFGLAGAERLRRRARRPDPSLQSLANTLADRLTVRAVDVLLCARVASPILIGILKPAILLPPSLLADLSPHQLELILLHELAHVRRCDNLVNLLQRLIESLLFFHPAVWLVSAWVRQEREHCCDDIVLSSTSNADADRHEYAAVLLAINQFRQPLLLAATAASGANLTTRIRRILTQRNSMRISRASLLILAIPVLFSVLLLTHAAASLATAPTGKIITVAKQGGDYATIQSAIDAAPDGAIIRIAQGTWEESLTISKPLTLEGAGWEQTTLSFNLPPDVQQAAREVVKQIQGEWHKGPWFDRTNAAFRKYPLHPVLNIKDVNGVTIRNLKIASTPGAHWHYCPLAEMTLVNFDHSTGRIENCGILGSPGNGITVSPRSDLTLSHSLIAGLWNTGVAVGSYEKDAEPAKAVITDCDIRTCYYAGIVLYKNTDATIERCRISATAWHGIFYDNTSPIIRDNMIFSVARVCLYASGNTHATVTGNVIAGSEETGMWCLPGNHDVITENTFTNNTASGIQVTGDSSPTVERNIFFNQHVAITCYTDGASGKILGHPKLASNWIWPDPKTTMPLQPGVDATTHVQDIGFVGNNFILSPNSPARAAHVGAANPPSDDASFSYNQPEERAIMPEKGGHDYQIWSLFR